MVKKVSLDRLDMEEPPVAVLDTKPDGEENPPVQTPVKWYRSRLFFVLGAAFLLLSAVAAGLYLFFAVSGEKEARHTASPPVAASRTAGEKEKKDAALTPDASPGGSPVQASGSAQTDLTVEALKDFLIPFPEGNKNVLVIDVVFEIESTCHAVFQQKMSLIRASTFSAVSETAADIIQGRNKMDVARSKIIVAVEAVLGKGSVKNVWFPKFVVL